MGGGNLTQILISFLILIAVIAVIGGLIWAIEQWIMHQPLPGPVKLVIGIILIILVIIWGIHIFGGA